MSCLYGFISAGVFAAVVSAAGASAAKLDAVLVIVQRPAANANPWTTRRETRRLDVVNGVMRELDAGANIIMKRHWTKALIVVWLLAGLLPVTGTDGSAAMAQALERFEFSEPHLGTLVAVTLYAPTETVATEAATAAYARIKVLNRILSDYQDESEVARLCRTAGSGMAVEVSPELFEVLSRSLSLSEATEGAFDPTISPVIKLWRTARKQRQLPDPQQLATARGLVGWKNVKLDAKRRMVELLKPGMQLDFGGIAKGYIAQQVSDLLTQRGLKRCLIAVAGDIVAGDPPLNADGKEAEGWKIGVAPLDKPDGTPSRLLRLKNCAVSTSGDAFQFVEIGGVRYSHIVDPKTGLGLTQRSSVTIIAPDGADADGLATAVTILGVERGLKLIELSVRTTASHKTAALIVFAQKDGLTVSESPHFKAFVIDN